MTVRDIMTSPAPTCAPDTRVEDVARRLLNEGIVGLAVVDDKGETLGLVSRHDLVAKHARVHAPWYLGILGGVLPFDHDRTGDELQHVLAVTARELMATDVPAVTGSSAVDDAASLLVDDRFECLLVMDDGALVGLLTEENILRLLLTEERDEPAGSPD